MGRQKADIRMPTGTSEVKNWISNDKTGILGGHTVTSEVKIGYQTLFNPSNISQYKIVTCSVTSVTGVHM